ncbi:hypothetical protein [Streptomyces sp. NPDC051211]|uniref:hypothetical protein n=1 Tax=Streptomyces sp. NPDC051211 TaxID=3154643 RepID=UPI0034508472
MTLLDASTGRRRRPVPPGHEESVQHSSAPQHAARQPADPPIYRDLIDRWSVEGRTLPGRRDPEWSRLASAPVWPSGPLFEDTP